MTHDAILLERLKRTSRQAAAGAMVVAVAVLLGWQLNLVLLQSFHPGLVSMSVATAIATLLCGAAVLLLQKGRSAGLKNLGRALGGLVLLYALATLIHGPLAPALLGLSGWQSGEGGVYPTAMSAYTAVALTLLSLALLLLNWETDRGYAPAQVLALGSLGVTYLVLIGYAYDISSIIHGTSSFPMALNTAVALTLLGLGALCARPERGPMVIFSFDSPGAHLLRRLLPALLALPVAIGWLRVQAERAGLFEAWFGVAMMTTLMTASFVALTWWNAYALDRKDAEREEAYRQLQAADKHKDEFLAVVSHELRTPLNFIIGFVSFLQDGIGGRLNPEQQGYADKAMAGAERLLGLIDDLVEYARMLSGKLTLDPVPTPYDLVVHEVLERVGPAAQAKGVAVEAAVEPLELACVDGYRMAQALYKLVDNAIKFTPEGGLVRVTAGMHGGELKTEVADTGPGIAPEAHEAIFRHFRQADMSATRTEGGLGLGLAIARAIIEAHGGRLGVRSEPGHGSTFWFSLPAREAR